MIHCPWYLKRPINSGCFVRLIFRMSPDSLWVRFAENFKDINISYSHSLLFSQLPITVTFNPRWPFLPNERCLTSLSWRGTVLRKYTPILVNSGHFLTHFPLYSSPFPNSMSELLPFSARINCWMTTGHVNFSSFVPSLLVGFSISWVYPYSSKKENPNLLR